jgi:ATP/maltotriose-dependent transcriptional regulator MalT
MNDMTMAFFREDPNTSFELPDFAPAQGAAGSGTSGAASIPLIKSKLRIPDPGDIVPRKWLNGVLEKSSRSAAATIVVGRAGTGKTTAAAEFARERDGVTWYTIDAVDGDWRTFQSYFRTAVFHDAVKSERFPTLIVPGCETPLDLFADITAGLELRSKQWPKLLVLDGIHHLFDRPWFHDFFEYLVASTPVNSHTLMLSRSKPPTPIWRMRSKQVLNVVDEKLLSFSATEAEEFLAYYGCPPTDTNAALTESFGHVGGLRDFVRTRTAA